MGSKKVDPNVGLAQREQAEIARSAESRANANDAYYRENFAPRALEQMDAQLALSKEEAARQRELSDYSLGLSRKYDQRYWDTTAKQQDAFYRMVDEYDSPGAQEREATRATADVAQGAATARAGLSRSMARMGVNPGSGAYFSAMNDSAMDEGLARAGAATMAREAARREGLSLRAQAAGLGGNLTGASSGYLGQSGGFGMGSLNAMGSGMNAIGAAQGGFNSNNASWTGTTGLASSAWGNVGSLGLQASQLKGNGFNLGRGLAGAATGFMKGGGWGALAGGLGGAFGG